MNHDVISSEPIYATSQLSIEQTELLHHFMAVDSPVSGTLTARMLAITGKHNRTETLTSVARGEGF